MTKTIEFFFILSQYLTDCNNFYSRKSINLAQNLVY